MRIVCHQGNRKYTSKNAFEDPNLLTFPFLYIYATIVYCVSKCHWFKEKKCISTRHDSTRRGANSFRIWFQLVRQYLVRKCSYFFLIMIIPSFQVLLYSKLYCVYYSSFFSPHIPVGRSSFTCLEFIRL